MSQLFASVYLDEDVDVLVAVFLRARGFDVTTVRDEGRRSAPDAEQLAYAVEQGRLIVTHNRDDFVALAEEYRTSGRGHRGIVIAVQHPWREVAARLETILNDRTADELEDQLLYI